MAIAADAVIRFAERHAEKAEELAAKEHRSRSASGNCAKIAECLPATCLRMRPGISGKPCRLTGSLTWAWSPN